MHNNYYCILYKLLENVTFFINYLLQILTSSLFFFFSLLEPDSPPVNLTVVNTTPSTATIAWSAPEKANGAIQQYEVLYENESYSALVNTSSNKVTLFSLKPFSFYNVSVSAYTLYGNGNQTSDTLYLLSGEDGALKDVPTFTDTFI